MKKLLGILLAVMLLATLAVTAFAADDPSAWDGQSVSSSLTKVDGVYQISNGADLKKFADMINNNQETGAKYELTANINLGGNSFAPIGYKATEDSHNRYSFKGEFNGNNFTISNATISAYENMGLFGYVNEANIYDLNLDYITVKQEEAIGAEPAVGVLAGSAYKATITDVKVGENCVISGVQRVGGVVGSVRDGCLIDDCDNKSDVTCTGMYCGGIIGAAHDLDISIFGTLTGDPATIKNCDNEGNVDGNTEVGGIVGYTDQSTVQDCTNSGTVEADGNYGAGGIIGFDAYNPRSFLFISYEPSKGATVSGCTNSGNVTGSRSGGIVGTLGVTPGQEQPDSAKTLTTITGCTNTGNITGTDGKCGAIFGYQISYAHGDAPQYVQNLIVHIDDNCTFNCTVNNVQATVATSSTFVN